MARPPGGGVAQAKPSDMNEAIDRCVCMCVCTYVCVCMNVGILDVCFPPNFMTLRRVSTREHFLPGSPTSHS